MVAQEVLLLGDRRLRIKCDPVCDFNEENFFKEKCLLQETLEDFRQKNGFGRAISAPQIGITKRFIACNLGKQPFIMINPEITYYSKETFSLWVN